MVPKIDYQLLGKAVEYYFSRGFEYVEVPWAVEEMFVRATLPDWANTMAVGQKMPSAPISALYAGEDCLVGSAEQGFLSMGLAKGLYVGVTPCFRIEDTSDLFYQDMFMKAELFSPDPDIRTVGRLIEKAEAFFQDNACLSRMVRRVETGEGVDLMLGDVEIGSYGVREHPDFGRWAYGTGLALPRFSVANALSRL